MNHSPPRIESAVDLPSPCRPSRISTLSTFVPGFITRATAPIIQRLATFMLYGDSCTPMI
ncbi:hypothetical protein D9M71_738860 [compost metagenome]